MFKKMFAFCYLILSLNLLAYAYEKEEASEFSILEGAKLRVFELLYPEKMQTKAQKEMILKKYFTSTQEYDIYRFPNQTIQSVYNAYVQAYPEDFLGASVLHKELPMTDKAFKADSNMQRLGYVLMYVWENDKQLTVTNTRIDDDVLCAKEVLQFNQQSKETILKTSLEQYCFN